ncbi:hypothetical protein BKA82DRAFT_4204271 [Pisolithus tinctorius]|nr:hypothetical protein BKA82DRAFT_4204271 [Pisolithus tinctorius]
MENPVKFGICLLLCTFIPDFLPSEVGNSCCLCITPYTLLEYGNLYDNLQGPIYIQTATTMSHFSQMCPVVLTTESQNVHVYTVATNPLLIKPEGQ